MGTEIRASQGIFIVYGNMFGSMTVQLLGSEPETFCLLCANVCGGWFRVWGEALQGLVTFLKIKTKQ